MNVRARQSKINYLQVRFFRFLFQIGERALNQVYLRKLYLKFVLNLTNARLLFPIHSGLWWWSSGQRALVRLR